MDEREVKREEWARADVRAEYEGASCLATCLGSLVVAILIVSLSSAALSLGADEGATICVMFPAFFILAAVVYGWLMRRIGRLRS
jgi:MFS family permease